MQIKFGAGCLVVPSKRQSRPSHQRRARTQCSVLLAALRRTAAPKSVQRCGRRRVRPRNVASEHSGCQNAPWSERRHLTPPSSGRRPDSFAAWPPPLMSNVRSHMTSLIARAVIAMVVLLGTALSVVAQEDVVSIAGATLRLPSPRGFLMIPPSAPSFVEGEQLTVPSNRLVAL